LQRLSHTEEGYRLQASGKIQDLLPVAFNHPRFTLSAHRLIEDRAPVASKVTAFYHAEG
jgi:hypothetical protein